jgi:hypothetical protein
MKHCRRGGMVDTADLKSVALKGVPVRVRPAVFLLNKRVKGESLTEKSLTEKRGCARIVPSNF